jgi:hypothetical protein
MLEDIQQTLAEDESVASAGTEEVDSLIPTGHPRPPHQVCKIREGLGQ